MDTRDTIFAQSSGRGRAGLAVVRASGPLAKKCAVLLRQGLPPARYFSVRSILDGNGEEIDSGPVLWLPGPGTFTGEDTVEFHVHGGTAVVSALLVALSGLKGFRLAEPGEFTRRAFMNGRFDLMAAEGIADLILAETAEQRRQALHQIRNAGPVFEGLRIRLISLQARLEAGIDFSDEGDVGETDIAETLKQLHDLCEAVEKALASGKRGERIRDGIRVVVAGSPNAGKSSLVNELAGRDVAIVSEMEGTTRDSIEVHLDLGGMPVILIDTAGLRQTTSDTVEMLGIDRTRTQLTTADIVLWLIAPGRLQDALPGSIDSHVLRIASKADLGRIEGPMNCDLAISVRTGQGIEELLKLLTEQVQLRLGDGEAASIVRERHREALASCLAQLRLAQEAVAGPAEVVAEHVRLAGRELARLVGRIDVEHVLDSIFSKFCIGK